MGGIFSTLTDEEFVLISPLPTERDFKPSSLLKRPKYVN